jgi:hypothetical protein
LHALREIAALPSAKNRALGKELLCRQILCRLSLPSATLGKVFAECKRVWALGKEGAPSSDGVSLLGKEKMVEIINEKDKDKRNIILTYSLMLLFAPLLAKKDSEINKYQS